MKRYLVFILVGLFAFSSKMDAQVLKPLPIEYFHAEVQPVFFEQTKIANKGTVIQNNPALISPLPFSPNYSLKCTLPKGAIFCRMEDAIYTHLNFWVKFRMGTDDRYSN
jgi:hypothetical protein